MDGKTDTLPAGKRLIDIEAVGEKLDVSKWTIYRMIKHRQIPFRQIAPKTYRFDPDVIDKWISDGMMKTVADV